MGLSFTIAAAPRQRSHSQVRVPRDSWTYFTLSDSRLPQRGGPGPCIYIPQEQGGPGAGFPFRRLLRLAGLRWRYSNPPPRGFAPVLIWTAAYIELRYPRRCLLHARIHGRACWFPTNDLASKSLQLPFPYPWKYLFNTQPWSVFTNHISAEMCLPTRFLETGLHVTILTENFGKSNMVYVTVNHKDFPVS
jgi:hypothetical protein